MRESIYYWPSLVLAVSNLTAAALWLATLRVRVVLAVRPGGGRAARREEEPPAPAADPVEWRLADDIRQWRAACATGAEPDPGGLEHWIAEVERSERQSGGGAFLPGTWRKAADRAVARGRKRPGRALSSMARTLTGPRP